MIPVKLRQAALCTVLLPAALLMGSQTATADTLPNIGCMQDLAGFNLNCRANDVRIANATGINILDDGCAFLGDTVDFEATFEVLLTAQERHDIGLYFATDGDPNMDGAISGTCSVSNVDFEPDPPWLDLDGTNDPLPGDNKPSGIQDTCGDIDDDHNPLFPVITLTNVACIDTDNDGKLNLPNCTSWRQPGANDLCVSPADAFPGAPSKCRCDIGFNIDIDVPPAELLVTKTANPTSVDEPSGEVTFTVTVTNIGIDPNNDVTLNSLMDSIYNDITTTGHDGITNTTCSVPQIIPPDDGNIGGIDTYTCGFTATVIGNGGDVEIDTVTASGVDDNGNMLDGMDDATVTINDVQPTIAVNKLANGEDSTTVPEPGDVVTFSVAVTNNSVSSDPVTIDMLMDDIHGDITLAQNTTCSVPQTIQPGDTYNCSFTAFVGNNYTDSETDTVTASGTDDEGNAVSASDPATVLVTNLPSMITLLKTVSPDNLDEPGGQVTYTFKVTNTSDQLMPPSPDTVFIDTLTDDKLGDLDGQGDCSVTPPQTLLPGGMYTCSVMTDVMGNGNTSLTNTATASGLDDDGEEVEAMDNAIVNFNNVPPAASLLKDATMAVVTYVVTVTNDSDAEALTLDALSDDMFGDITQIQGDIQSTTCAVPQTLQPSGEMDDTYICSFDAKVSTSPHTDTVTGTVNDDDASMSIMPSDSATVTFE